MNLATTLISIHTKNSTWSDDFFNKLFKYLKLTLSQMSIPTEKIDEFRDALDKSARPLFFYDGDLDGLSSYTLLFKYKGEGKGIMVSGRPKLGEDFARKYEEYQPDAVFILDLAQITQEFIDMIPAPIYWLDHHEPEHPELHMPKRMKYYNPRLWNNEDGRPTAYWAYLIANKQDVWIATAGIISDYHFEEAVIEEFRKFYPDLLPRTIKHQGEALYDSKIGELIRILNFNLKGPVSNALTSVKIFTRIEHPDEILKQESAKGKYLYKRYEKVNVEYQKLLTLAKTSSAGDKDFMIFTYHHDKYSLSGELANELKYRNKNKAVIIGRHHDNKVIMSIRSENYEVHEALKVAMEGKDGHGGGHPKACGALIAENDFPEFIEQFKAKFLEEKKNGKK